MPKQPTRPDAPTDETPELSPLARRLLRRHTEPLGLIDVKHAARHHERLTRFAGRSRLLEQLLARYAAADDATHEGQSLLMQRWGGQPGLAPPSGSGPAFPADPSTPPVPPTFLAPTSLGAAGVPPPPAAPTPPAPPQPPAQKLRVSRDSAARAMRRDRKTVAEPTRKTDATPPPPAPPAVPAGKPGGLPRAAEQTPASRHEPAETSLVVRQADRGHATEPAPSDATPTTTGNISGDRAKLAGRAEGRADEVSHAMPALPLLKRQEPVVSRVEVINTPARPAAVSDSSKAVSDDSKVTGEAKSTRVNERETHGAGPTGLSQAQPVADMPLARAAIPADMKAGGGRGENAGAGGAQGAGTGGAKNARAGVVSAEVRGGADAGPAEIVWRKSDGRAAGGEARPAAGTQRDSAATPAADAEATQARPSQGRAADDPEPTPAARPEVDLGRLTDRVMRAISRRLAVERERRGVRP
jgi:hypothetical protein